MSGDSVLVQRLRSGQWPASGGSLCLTGDCPNCLATVDGITYTRTCRTPYRDGAVVTPQPPHDALPPLESPGQRAAPDVRTIHCDVVVIGQGPSGRAEANRLGAEGRHVETLDGEAGEDATGIYPGPLVVARTPAGIRRLRPRGEIVVATGAAEIPPAVPGTDLQGLLTRTAAERLAAAGVPLGRVVAVGSRPAGIDCAMADGVLVRLESSATSPDRVGAAITRAADGTERRYPCDTVSVFLGWHPRDALLRMARGMNVRGVGSVMRPRDVPPAPDSGVVCRCLGVTVDDLRSVTARGFRALELVKRATLAGTGPCQGMSCVPHLRAFLAAGGAPTPEPFTARPLARPLTLGEAAAGWHHVATPRTALDGEHRALGATMERLGGWWRPWHYGEVDAEYRAVRGAVSISDVSTLGKLQVSGPGALALLEHLYPVPIKTLTPGRSRYVLMLDERGYVLDDGLVSRDGDSRFTLSFTSGGASTGELWVRDWAEALDADVRLLNLTSTLGAINVTGPRATELLRRAGVSAPPAFMRHAAADVAGIACRIFRVSFTGEVSYELHHDAADSVTLWRTLLTLGDDLGVRPHGLEALLRLRLDKGHIVVGQDTDFDSTPRRLGLDAMVRLDKPAFVGRQAVLRTNIEPLDKRLRGFTMAGAPPPEGATIWRDGQCAGHVTSAAWSPPLGCAVMLGWLREGDDAGLTIDGRAVTPHALPFYDPDGDRARG